MKRLAALCLSAWLALSAAAAEGTEPPVDREVREKMFLTQIMELNINAADYLGKTVALEGMFMTVETGEGGPGRELWVVVEPDKPVARLGAGGVHHVAFRVADEAEQGYWHERVTRSGLRASPFIDRYYFRSIYFRISNGILFEIATDGPGFTADEDLDRLGERLALPPFLEPQRQEIEAGLKPIVVAHV